jgi:hypothetical protein
MLSSENCQSQSCKSHEEIDEVHEEIEEIEQERLG